METYIGPTIHTLTQCQFCHQGQSEGVTLQRCSGCKIYTYCSVACQMEAWKTTHKRECSRIDLPSLAPQRSRQMVAAAMRAFANKHMNVIVSYAMEALEVDSEPERGLREALVIRLKLRPSPTLVENMFQATSVRVCSAEELDDPHRFQEMFDYFKVRIQIHRARGWRGGMNTYGFNVLLLDVGWKTCDVIPVLFSAAGFHMPPNFGRPYTALEWDEALLALLNRGVVTEEVHHPRA